MYTKSTCDSPILVRSHFIQLFFAAVGQYRPIHMSTSHPRAARCESLLRFASVVVAQNIIIWEDRIWYNKDYH